MKLNVMQWLHFASRDRQNTVVDIVIAMISPRLSSNDAYAALIRRYVVVYALGTFGDWIQGAYLYAAYRRHGLVKRDIGYIYILGYVVSATIGTTCAALGDTRGHRALVQAYGMLYAVSCLLLRSSATTALIVSRILGGIAYSLLFSNFESWVITEADAMGIDRKKLAGLFSVATLFNAASAVLAGLVGNFVVELTISGELSWIGMGKIRREMGAEADTSGSVVTMSKNMYAPAFDIGAISLLLCAAGAKLFWSSNGLNMANLGAPGLSTVDGSQIGEVSISVAVRTIMNSAELFRLGAVNFLYEAALHLFVFIWTPVLEKRLVDAIVPYGTVFSVFMVCKMFGSQVFKVLESKIPAENLLRMILVGSAVSFFVVVFFTGYWVTLAAFCAFEFGVGIYWPVMSILRANYVPDKMRATMTSAFRIPLNILVVVLLLIASRASDRVLLGLNAVTMVFSLACFRAKPLMYPRVWCLVRSVLIVALMMLACSQHRFSRAFSFSVAETGAQWGSMELNGAAQWSSMDSGLQPTSVLLFLTTHASDFHMSVLQTQWPNLFHRSRMLRQADVIIFSTGSPESNEKLAATFSLSPKCTVVSFPNPGKQSGANLAMYWAANSSAFDGYEWVLRLNPDVLILNDTWLCQTMGDSDVDAIFVDCKDQCSVGNCSHPEVLIHTDFFAIRPQVLQKDSFNPTTFDRIGNAERVATHEFQKVLFSGRHRWIPGVGPMKDNCRVRGDNSPIIHSHNLAEI